MEPKRLLPLTNAIALALAASGAYAATITVTDGGDPGTSGTCTLRQAIETVNSVGFVLSTCTPATGNDTIVFAAGLINSTITLTAGRIDITDSVTITGSGQTITATPNNQVMSISNNPSTKTAPTITLTNLTLTGAQYYDPGAGLEIAPSIAVLSSSAQRTHNPTQQIETVSPPPPYAPIVTLDHVTISNNASDTTAGGLFIIGATVTINHSTISGNSLTATNSYGAGGIYITTFGGHGSKVTITDSTISGNSVSGHRYSLVGGIYIYGSTVTIANSTISDNSASGGNCLAGGLSLSGGQAAIYNSTISGNGTSIVNNAAGGFLVGCTRAASVTLDNTILAGNQIVSAPMASTVVAAAQPDMFVANGSDVIAQSNLMGTALSGAFADNGNVFNDVPGLGPLTNNGGPTLTMKPKPDSPVLGIGNIILIPAGVSTDQRGTGYQRVVGNRLDLGSVEAAAGQVAVITAPAPTLSVWTADILAGLLVLFGLRRKRQCEG